MTYFQRVLAALMSLTMFVGVLVPVTAAQAAIPSTNVLIKGKTATVYWYASNGKRYAFPNIQIFWSYFNTSEFKNIRTLSEQELASIPFGGNVVYRPGYKLIKSPSNEKVYAVARYGVIRWVKNEQVAAAMYGSDWINKIEDLSDGFFYDYTQGTDINSTWDYNVGNEYNAVRTPSDNLRENYYNNNYVYPVTNSTYLNNVSVSTNVSNRYTSNNVEYVTFSASVTDYNSNSSSYTRNLQLIDTANNTVLKDCGYATYCEITLSGTQYVNRTLSARVNVSNIGSKDSNSMSVSYGTTGSTVQTTSSDYRVNASQGSQTHSVRLMAVAPVNLQWPPSRLDIYRSDLSAPIGTCYGTYSCTMEHATNAAGNYSFYAIFTLTDGTTKQSPTITSWVN